MVLNKDYNPDDDWEALSSGEDDAPEEAPDQAPSSEAQAPPVQQDSEAAKSVQEEEAPKEAVDQEGKEEAATNEESPMEAPVDTASNESQLNESKLKDTREEDNPSAPVEVATEESASDKAVKSDSDNATTILPNNEQEPLLPEPATEVPASTNEIPPSPSHRQKPNNDLPAWLRGSLQKIGSVIKDVDEKHDLQRKARNSVKLVGDELNKLGDSIQKEASTAKATLNRESLKLTHAIQAKADEVDWHTKTKAIEVKAKEAAQAVENKAKGAVKTVEDKAKQLGASVKRGSVKAGETVKTGAAKAGETVKTGAVKAGEKVKTLNKDGKVTELIAAAAMVGGAVMLAKGNTGAGAAMMATGGATYAAGEATRGARRYDAGLNEDLHMD